MPRKQSDGKPGKKTITGMAWSGENGRCKAMDEQAARQAVADAGRMLLRERLVARTWGNVSCRTGPQSFVITPSGLRYERMEADDMVLYDMAEDTWTGCRLPSSEKGVHAAAYRRFQEAGAVIHTHQTYASALGLAGFGALPLTEEANDALGGIALAAYGLPGSERLMDRVAEAMESGAHTVLMAHHGALVVGGDMDEAFRRAGKLEDLCRSFCRGQPVCEQDEAPGLAALAEQIKRDFQHVAYTVAPAVRKTAETTASFGAQLDDMAQMIGPELIAAEMDAAAIAEALRKRSAVLVSGAGAICRADSAGDCDALRLLVEKACVGFLHTSALGVSAALPEEDMLFMRRIYLESYSKKIDE